MSNRPPRRAEPLILAALLKLMLSRSPVAEPFYFEMSDLIAELGWPDTWAHQDRVDSIIEEYVSLIFHKYEHRRRQRYKVVGPQWGRYKLLSSYLVGFAKEPREACLTRIYNRVDFDTKFVKGLNEGRLIFADIDFGLVNFYD